ncbi:hypothetical protein HYQ45_018499 [Verticillium longisporum]|uniref:Uncharacterized protein n=1 Tax=Verticillium longisporum TaxID=100787 RepID=A0A0G4KVP1_VERLO|nr:hypothetical protein HYQ44_018548 [Verticillium longisporum]KAG7105807.1 hypothetical protein HYQ45_018499 [Verticillium longisporum]CRK13807.1 hypothetical protein BN1708_010954 [Verticillium longisporum]CRK29708.1 hypothetical protein BN1723_003585 [Verticillium longisporum]
MANFRKPNMGSVLKSPIVLFKIGLEHEEFRVHECILLPLSPQIRENITAGGEGNVVDKFLWEDVEPTTFADLVEFAYGTDYTTDIFPEHANDGNDDDIYNLKEWIDSWTGKKGAIYHHGLRFVESRHDTPEGYFPGDQDAEHKPINKTKCSTTIFRHIKLYALAKRCEIQSLEDICLYKLRNCLVRLPWEFYDEDFILKATRYIWANTPEGERSLLRRIWIDFILCDLDCLIDGRLEDPIRCIKNFGSEFLLAVPPGYWQELQSVREQRAKK